MSKSTQLRTSKKLKPLPTGLVEIYGLIAVLIVLIPEKFAELAISIGQFNSESKLPLKSKKWEVLPELRLAAMSLRELRNLAKQMGIHGYSSEDRRVLSRRILKVLQRSQLKSFNFVKF